MDEDIAAAIPPLIARAAGGVVALAGIVVALTGGQTLAMVSIRGPLAAAPWVLLGSGVGEVVLATLVFRARAWGVMGAAGASFALVMLAGAWLVISLSHGLFSLYALGGPCVSLAAAVVSLIALGPSQRASAARERLKQQGMDLGI
jgi:hypothetical protein